MVHRHRRETHADKNRHPLGDQGFGDGEQKKKTSVEIFKRGLLENRQYDLVPI